MPSQLSRCRQIELVVGLILLPALAIPAWPAGPPAPVAAQVGLSVRPWSAQGSWRLYFERADPRSVATIRCRMVEASEVEGSEPPEWITAGDDVVDLGKVSPGRHRIEIEALNGAGERTAAYTLWFDPEEEEIRAARDILEDTAGAWIAFSDRDDWEQTSLVFTHLVVRKTVLREVRYSLDGCALDRRWPLAPAGDDTSPGDIGADDKLVEWVPKTVSFVCVQLVYRDGVVGEARRAYHRTKVKHPAAVPLPDPPPVKLSASRSNAGWELRFDLRSPLAVREVRYRLAGEAEWRSTGRGTQINLDRNERMPRTALTVDPDWVAPGRQRVEVRLIDWSGVESGPHVLWFDAAAEVLADAKRLLGDPSQPWVSFSDWTTPTYAIFGPAFERDALREIRYSFGGCALDQVLPFTPWTDLAFPPEYRDKNDVAMPESTSTICVQLVYLDGDTTEPRRFVFERNKKPEEKEDVR